MPAALRPLRLPAFPSLGLAYLVNELGNWLGEIALALLVFDQTGDPMAVAALFCGMHFAPALLGPPIVARLERHPARVTLPALYAIEAAAFAALALLSSQFSLLAVLALATLDGSVASAARALTRASAAAVLAPAGQLREGNALLNIAFTVGAAGGPAMAGLVVAAAGIETALLADAASFLAVAVLLGATRRLKAPEPDDAEAGWAQRLRRGLAYVGDRPALRRLLGAQAAAFVFFALVIPVEVVFAKQTLDAGDAGYGALLAAWGAGMVAGSLMFAALRAVSLRTLLLGLDARDRPRLPRDRRRAEPDRCLRGVGARRARQRRPMDRAGDCRPGAHPGGLPGPRAGAARGDRERDAGGRLPARRRDRCDLRAPRQLRRRRCRRARRRAPGSRRASSRRLDRRTRAAGPRGQARTPDPAACKFRCTRRVLAHRTHRPLTVR